MQINKETKKPDSYKNLKKDRISRHEMPITHTLIYDNVYAHPWGLSTLAKELSATASEMQSSSKELSTLVADRV